MWRDDPVLVWCHGVPAKVSKDFGSGKKCQRTITWREGKIYREDILPAHSVAFNLQPSYPMAIGVMYHCSNLILQAFGDILAPRALARESWGDRDLCA